MRQSNSMSRAVCAAMACISLVSAASADVTSNLIAHYPFSGSADDATGNGHNGAVHGATLTTDRMGNANSAYLFDGNDRIDVPDSQDFTFGAGSFTIATWMKYSALGSYYAMGHDEGGGNRNKWIFWVNSSGFSLHLNSPSTGGYNPVTYTGWLPQVDTWYHLAVTREGSVFTAYLNGDPVAFGSDSRTLRDPATTLQVGTAEPEHPERGFRGGLDDVRLYDRALSPDDMRELVPEPATLSLLALGGLALLRRRRTPSAE